MTSLTSFRWLDRTRILLFMVRSIFTRNQTTSNGLPPVITPKHWCRRTTYLTTGSTKSLEVGSLAKFSKPKRRVWTSLLPSRASKRGSWKRRNLRRYTRSMKLGVTWITKTLHSTLKSMRMRTTCTLLWNMRRTKEIFLNWSKRKTTKRMMKRLKTRIMKRLYRWIIKMTKTLMKS